MRGAICCLLLLLAVDASAATEYWVSVASTKDLEDAERLQLKAGQALPEAFNLQPANTAKGFFYRVVTGPFLSIDSAKRVIADAVKAGFDQAWVVAVDTDSMESMPLTSPESYPEMTTPEPDMRTSYPDMRTSYPDMPEDSLESDDLDKSYPPPEEPPPAQQRPPHKLVETAPPGYQLNKLTRNESSDDG